MAGEGHQRVHLVLVHVDVARSSGEVCFSSEETEQGGFPRARRSAVNDNNFKSNDKEHK